MEIRELRCTHCHAPLRPERASAGLVACEYCGTTLRVSGFGGAVLSAADFRDRRMTGWSTAASEEIELTPGPPPELLARFGPTTGTRNLLTSAATFDDFDASVTLRLLWGDLTSTYAGLKFRRDATGYYEVCVHTKGLVGVHYIAIRPPAVRTLVGWTTQPAVRTEPGAPNQIRVICIRDRIKVLINGEQIASLRDDANAFGTVGIFGSSDVPMAVAFSALVVREVEPSEEEEEVAAAFDVVLLAPASNKIQAIKALREVVPLGLKEAKDLVESTRPTVLLREATRERAEQLASTLRAAGCRIESRPAAR